MKFLRRFHGPAAWPSPVLVAIFACVYLLFAGGIWLISRRMPNELNMTVFDSGNAQFFSILIVAAAVVHVFFRLLRFHPACNPLYASWLSLSPWNSAKPLPLGPIHPVWQDVAVLATLTALGNWHAHVNPAFPWVAAGLAYTVGLTVLLGVTKTWPSFIAAAFLWPSFLLTKENWPAGSVILTALLVVLWVGTRKSLQTFPWREKNRTHPGLAISPGPSVLLRRQIRIEVLNANAMSSTAGWAFAQLSPKARFSSISVATSFWVSALIGWWVYCGMVNGKAESVPGLILAYGIVGGLFRLLFYLGGLAPSFSFCSRLFFGQWIVPRFDQIFVAPLIAIVVAVIGAVVMTHSIWFRAVHAFFLSLILFIVFSARPTMRKWVLTGAHRFRPPLLRQNSQQGHRPI